MRVRNDYCLTALVIALGASGVAHAEPDTFGLGDGHHLERTISGAEVINTYAPVLSGADAGSTEIFVGAVRGGEPFAPGDMVLVHVSALSTDAAASALAPAASDLTSSTLGRYELARVAAVDAPLTKLTLTAPLVRPREPSTILQVVRVIEASTVTLPTGSTISALPWDGSSGGIVALFATGLISMAASTSIEAAAAGYRPGTAADDPASTAGCVALDGASPVYGQKGEGADPAKYGPTYAGFGTFGLGGGGGNCLNAGGGGGAAAGNGGKGGAAWANDTSHDACAGAAPCAAGSTVAGTQGRDVGGRGGVAPVGASSDRLLFGGGGGAGQGDGNTSDRSATSGGAGSGVVFVRAAAITGTATSRFYASGRSACSVAASCFASADAVEGAGGGGGGGTIHVRVVEELGCPSVMYSAEGGGGGATSSTNPAGGLAGGGGGGGGGWIYLQSPQASACTQRVAGGGALALRGEIAGGAGAFRALASAFASPPAPVLSPLSSTTRRPQLAGTAPPSATVIIYLDDLEWQRVNADMGGAFAAASSADVPSGRHTFTARTSVAGAESEASPPVGFDVAHCLDDSECPGDSSRPAVCLASGVCGDCSLDLDCSGADRGRRCLSEASCGCVTSADCGAELPVCSGGACRACAADDECPAAAPVCTGAGRCSVCDADSVGLCADAQPFCSAATESCVECLVDDHCAGNPGGQSCTPAAACGCTQSAECVRGRYCETGSQRCLEGCLSNDDCSGGLHCTTSDGRVGRCELPSADTSARTPQGCHAPGTAAGAWLCVVVVLIARRWRRVFVA